MVHGPWSRVNSSWLIVHALSVLSCRSVRAFSLVCRCFQINKGVYLERTPIETGVERAYLKHTLADGLKHRPTRDELAQKGILLEVG